MPKYVKEVYKFMWKKVFLSIGLIVVLIVGIILFYMWRENRTSKNIVNNETEISSEYVRDDCLNEWEDYAKTLQEEIEASKTLNEENRHYILKEKDGNICVYYINEKKEEILYKVTDISIEYLSEDDVKSLKEGIDVYGLQNLNQLIEDFE